MNALLRFARRPLGALIIAIAVCLVLMLALVLATGCANLWSCQ